MSGLSDYFTDEELRCKGSGKILLDPRFERALLEYREIMDIPLIPGSCCRSEAHNLNIGGAKGSYHLFESVDDGRSGTLAVDLKVPSNAVRAHMVGAALNLGWSVGIYKTFIHIDRRVDIGKPQVCFRGRY
ncbi:hypothetical protein KAR91_26555 [Candidatus Pacearchaeota archaeon]|nr:hypothetical protein [Candidatus Pacearchaeota archaeon]